MSLRTLDIADAVQPLAEYAHHLGEGPIIVTDRGEPVAAVVPIENADLESLSLSTNPEFVEIIERSRARGAREGRIPVDEMERKFQHRSRSGNG
jgi:antitoxin (DNA-binding transcriptional repressor) of toxin-antitoxin stability system